MDPDADRKRRAFETEALPHLDAVYRVSLRLCADPSQAEDLTQETMLKAYRSWHQYRQGTNAKAWLLTILRHTFINQYRRERKRAADIDVSEVEHFTVLAGADTDPEGDYYRQIVDDEVVRAIDQLPEDFRETLVLSDIEGLSYQEIADVTEVPVGTVKSRLFRARQALQARLRAYAVEMGFLKPEGRDAESR